MKKHLLLKALLLVTGLSFAQKTLSKEYSYTVSAPYKVFDAAQKFYFYKNNEILTVKIEEKEILLQKFGNGEKITFKSEKKYEKIFPKNYQVEKVMELNQKFYFFYSSWDGDKDKEELYVREIDFDKGVFAEDSKLLFKVDGKVTGAPLKTKLHWSGIDDEERGGIGPAMWPGGGSANMFTNGTNTLNSLETTDKFDFIQDIDNKKLLVQYRLKPKTKSDTKSYDIIGMVNFDAGLQMTSQNEVKMPYTERKMDALDYAIDKEGNTYVLAKVYHDDSNKSKKEDAPNYHMELLRIKNGTKEVQKTKIDVKDKFIRGLWLTETHGDYIVCAGFYNIGKKKFTSDGIFVAKAGKDGALYDVNTFEIPVELLNQNVSDAKKRKNDRKEEDGKAEFEAMKLQEVVVNADGSLLLIGEQYYTEVHQKHQTSNSKKMFNQYRTYHYNDLLAAKVDKDGKLVWMKKMPKRQMGRDYKGGMSYKHIAANGSHYFLFLDNVKNINLPADKKPALHSDGDGGYFTSYKINDATGAVSAGSVFNTRDVEDVTMHQFATDRILKTADDEFIIEFYKKKKEDVMMKVKML